MILRRVIAGIVLLGALSAPASLIAASSLPPDIETKAKEIELQQKLGSKEKIQVKPGFETLKEYFEDASTWLVTVAVGFCVIWVVIGGFEIMISGGGAKMGEGKSHITWALIGLTILIFGGAILRTLNSIFFQ